MQEYLSLSNTGSIVAFVLTAFLSAAVRSKPTTGTPSNPSETLVWEELQWETKIFSELSTLELYQIMKLRAEVFVVEVSFLSLLYIRTPLFYSLLYLSVAKLPVLRL
jgi:hypothetical protein